MFSDDILFKLIGLLFVLEILRQTDFFGGDFNKMEGLKMLPLPAVAQTKGYIDQSDRKS